MTSETAPFIFIVEDHPKLRENVVSDLREAGFAAHAVESVEEASAFLRDQLLPDMMLLDVRLGAGSGIDLIRQLNANGAAIPTIVVSGEASMTETLEAQRLGVYDFIEKPFTRNRLLQSVRGSLERVALQREVSNLRSHLGVRRSVILGRSAAMTQLRSRIDKVGSADVRVLVHGESGTGKELVANALHAASARAAGPFVKINCAAIPQHLIEDELFGHVRGAFTDAKAAKPGLFEEAHRGTLLLDEIGDMDLTLQARLLRVLEDGRVRRIGETADRVVDVRVIASTNRRLEDMVRERTFREDLYFRLATVVINVPPLRDRAGDVTLLFTHFLEEFCARNQTRHLTIAPEVFPVLEAYSWPGNVRELRNVAEQLSIFGTDPVTVDQLPTAIVTHDAQQGTGLVRPPDSTEILPLRAYKDLCEKEYIERVLRRTNWNITAAAKLLDIQRTYLHQKLTALNIRKLG